MTTRNDIPVSGADHIAQTRAPRRVVVTGIGALCGLGVGVAQVWDGILAGRSGVGSLDNPLFADMGCRIGALVPDFNPLVAMDAKTARRLDPFVQYGLVAACEAWKDAGLDQVCDQEGWDPARAGIAWGTAIGAIGWLERSTRDMINNKKLSPFFVASTLPNMAAGYISQSLNLQGPSVCQATACAASSHAMGLARMMIAQGMADVMVVGGSEQVVTPLTVAGHCAMGALSTRNSHPQQASRPWDRDRDGFVLGDGSGVLILEEETHARARGARIYAELVGFGLSSDAHHPTTPKDDGSGGVRAMRMALADARICTTDIDHINAHGTSTPAGDRAEVAGIKAVFGNRATSIPTSSTKSMTGHLLGAAGALEAVFSVLSLQHHIMPPTINLDEPEEGCDLDFVAHIAREKHLQVVMSNSFGFGGTTSSLIFRAY